MTWLLFHNNSRVHSATVGVSYHFLETVDGSGGYSSLFEAKASLWIVKNAGLTFKYSKGDTPVADQPIDLVTFGLEFKY